MPAVKPIGALLLVLVLCNAHASEPQRQAPFITTPAAVVERMLELAGTGPQDVVLDLGSGDGRIPITAARKFGARGVGVELDPRLVEQSRRNAQAAGVAERVSFEYADALVADISRASVVTLYLLPELLAQLEPRFLTELAPGTRIVAHAFTMVGWKPDRTEALRLAERHPGQGEESRLFLWVVPADVRGRWRGEGRELVIRQSYQEIEVEGAARASLTGREIAWERSGARFRGRVEGDRIEGELADGAGVRRVVFVRGR